MIDPQTVSKILDTADIVDVVSDFVSLRRRGVNYIGLCPFHDEKTGSFTVSPAKGICKCFGCGKGGTSVNFIMEHEQLDYPGALRYLAKKYNIPIQERELSDSEKANITERESLFAVNEWAKQYFSSTLKDNPEGRNVALSYFRERGINDASIEKFSLGYCLNDFSAMTKAAKSRGYKEEFLEKTGLSGKSSKGDLYDRFKGRVMFPVLTISGKVVAFGGRIMVKNDKTAKYVNSPESEIYHKSNELYGIFQSKNGIVKSDKCYLVEGYTDVISMHQSGITNVVASSGTALTHGQIRLIHRLTPNITVLYDGDPAGIKASLRGINLLLEEGMNVKVVLLPEGEDPDSYARAHNSVDFIDFIGRNEVDFIHFKINLLIGEAGNDPMKRAKLIQDITQSVAVIPDQIIRSVYVKECARLLDMTESIIVDEVSKIRNKAKAEEAKKQGFSYGKSVTRVTTPVYREQRLPQEEPPMAPPPIDYMFTGENTVEGGASADGAWSVLGEESAGFIGEFSTEGLYAPPEDEVLTEGYQRSNVEEKPHGSTLFFENEKEMMNFVVCHGDEVMLYEKGEDGGVVPVYVGQYILEELAELKESNGTCLYAPLYEMMLNILQENIAKPDFKAFRCFVNYPNPQVSMEAAELLSEKYQLSRIFTKSDEFIGDINSPKEVEEHRSRMKEKHTSELYHAVTKVVLTYKYKIIVDMHASVRRELKKTEQSGDTEAMFSALKRLTELNKILNDLSPLVGQRVINA